MKKLILMGVGLLLIVGVHSNLALAEDSNGYGDTKFDSEGNSYLKYEDALYGDDANLNSNYGKTVVRDDGITYTTYGNRTYDNRGNSWTNVGSTVYGSDGSSCHRYGSEMAC